MSIDIVSYMNRVSEILGVKYPIVQAPMGWIARSQLASAVSNAGGSVSYTHLTLPTNREV